MLGHQTEISNVHSDVLKCALQAFHVPRIKKKAIELLFFLILHAYNISR